MGSFRKLHENNLHLYENDLTWSYFSFSFEFPSINMVSWTQDKKNDKNYKQSDKICLQKWWRWVENWCDSLWCVVNLKKNEHINYNYRLKWRCGARYKMIIKKTNRWMQFFNSSNLWPFTQWKPIQFSNLNYFHSRNFPKKQCPFFIRK